MINEYPDIRVDDKMLPEIVKYKIATKGIEQEL